MTDTPHLDAILDDLRAGLATRRRRRLRARAGTLTAASLAAAFVLATAGGPSDISTPTALAGQCVSALDTTLPSYSTTLAACS